MKCCRKSFDSRIRFYGDGIKLPCRKGKNFFLKNREVWNREIIEEISIEDNESSEELYRLIEEAVEMINEVDHISKVNINAIEKVFEDILRSDKSIEEIVQASQVLIGIAKEMKFFIGDVQVEAVNQDILYRNFHFLTNKMRNLEEKSIENIVGAAEHSQIISKRTEKRIQRILALTMLQRRNIRDIEYKFKEILKAITTSEESIKQNCKVKKEIWEENHKGLEIDKKNIESTKDQTTIKEQIIIMNEMADVSKNLAQLVDGLKEVVLKFRI